MKFARGSLVALGQESSRRIVIFFAHPDFDRSHTNRALRDAVSDLSFVTFNDLYETYPDLLIDVKKEQALALSADLLVFQHPFFWYSSPAIIKQWYDMVLERGWAYGNGGTALRGKDMMLAVTTGGPEDSYRPDGYNRFTMEQLVAPQNQTAHLCGMQFLKPFIAHGASAVDPRAAATEAERFRRLLTDYASR